MEHVRTRTITQETKTTEDAMTADQKNLLANLYLLETDLSVDKLPYTDDFDRIYKAFSSQHGRKFTKKDVFQQLANLRKAGKLPKKLRPGRSPRPEPILAATA